jgi:transposase
MEGLRVTDAERGPDGIVTVWAVTDHRDAARCPDCGTVSCRAHEQVVTCPKDVRCSAGRVQLCWVKRRWKCHGKRCRRRTFTESVPQVPPRCQVTGRLREQAGAEVARRRGQPGVTRSAWSPSTCALYTPRPCRMLPDAVVVIDIFHVVQLAVKVTGDVRRRATREKYGRRGRAGDPEYGIKRLLGRNLENLTPAQFSKIVDTLALLGGRPGRASC